MIRLKDGGTEFGKISQNSNNLRIYSSISDGDILLQGNDGGSTITAVTIDMSEGGHVGIGSATPAYKLDVVDSDGGTLARFKDSDSSHAGLIIQ